MNVGWLAPVAGDRFKAACKYCLCILRAHYADLRHHFKSAKHQKNARWAEDGSGEPPVFLEKERRAESEFVTFLLSHDRTSLMLSGRCTALPFG